MSLWYPQSYRRGGSDVILPRYFTIAASDNPTIMRDVAVCVRAGSPTFGRDVAVGEGDRRPTSSCCAGTTHSGASIRVAIVHNFLRGPDAVSADGCFRGSGQRAPREVAENRHGSPRPISTRSLLTRRLADAFNRFGLELDINPAAQTAVDQRDEVDAAMRQSGMLKNFSGFDAPHETKAGLHQQNKQPSHGEAHYQ